MSNEAVSRSVVLHAPNSAGLDEFDIDAFMGTWHVVYSTLPLWKNKKDVSITYTPIEQEAPISKFNDLVEFRTQKSSKDSKPTRIEGVDTLDNLNSSELNKEGSNARPSPRFKWRGKGLLIISSSRWQILGSDTDWAVTYFEKTIFTPAGLDIYARDAAGLPEDLAKDVIEKTKLLGGEVGKLAEKFFSIERSK